MSPVRSLRGIRPFIWIPPFYTANWKFTVERSDGTVDDISDNISNLEIEDGVTESIGKFQFDIWDPNETYSKAWTGNEIVKYYSSYLSTPTTYYKFNGNSLDSIGTANGTDTDMTYATGVVGQAAVFDGATSYIRLPNTVPVPTGDYTISMWFYNAAGSNTFPTLYNRGAQSASTGYWWAYTTEADEARINWQYSTSLGGGSAEAVWWDGASTKDVWELITFVYKHSAATVELFVNGVSKGIKNLDDPRLCVADVMDIGTYRANNSFVLDGKIDDFRLYPKAISIEEIALIYNGGDGMEDSLQLRFRGRIEKPSKRGNKLKVVGRSEGVKLIDVTVTQAYDTTEVSAIFKDLVDKYGGGNFTYNNVATTTTDYTVQWTQKPFWEAIRELADEVGYDAYLDANLDFYFIEIGSRQNATDAIVNGINMMDIGDFTPDLSLVKNRVIVYGAEQEGIKVIYTAESTDATYGVNSDLGVKELIVEDDNVVTYTQAKLLGDSLLAKNQNPPILGDVTGIQLATIQPADSVYLSSPYDDIQPGQYNTVKYKHSLNLESGDLKTTVTVTKEPRKVYHILRDLTRNQDQSKKTSVNPEEMRFSYNFLYDADSGTHTNTQITSGVLKLQTGSSGNWVSAQRDLLTKEITEAYLIVTGQTLTGATFQVSGDDGLNFESITPKSKLVLSTAVGDKLKVKVLITDTNTQIDSLSLQYKVE